MVKRNYLLVPSLHIINIGNTGNKIAPKKKINNPRVGGGGGGGLVTCIFHMHIDVAGDFFSRAIGIIYFEKTFFKFYRRHFELISKFNVGLKTLLREGLSEPEFYGDLV